MEFEAIMKQITGGLTGDPQKDMKYLQEQMDKYKDHEYSKEIVRACGRLFYDLVPDDSKEEFIKALDNDNKGFAASLKEIHFNIYEKNYDRALKLAEEMVTAHEKMNLYADDAVSEYHCFTEPMQEMLYTYYAKPKKEIRASQIDYASLYFLYGSILVEMKRYDDAAMALAKAMKWNPASTVIAFEYAETFKCRGMMKPFMELTKETFKYAYRPQDLARCYRNLGFYYSETEDYETGAYCYIFSTVFQQAEIVQAELYYASQKSGKEFNPGAEDIKTCFNEKGIQYGPSEAVGFSYKLGKDCYETGNYDMAGYFLSIYAGFIDDDDEVQEMLNEISKKTGGKE